MPRGDRSGPMGMGPMTGRAAGFCAGYPAPGYTNPLPGRGAFGRGAWGGPGGRGHRNRYYATGLTGWQRAAAGWYPAQPGPAPYPYQEPAVPASADDEVRMIRSQIEMMEENIKAARDRLDELESQQD